MDAVRGERSWKEAVLGMFCEFGEGGRAERFADLVMVADIKVCLRLWRSLASFS